MSTQSTPLPSYFGWIDAMRGIAAISVVIFHYTHFYMADADARPIQVVMSDVPYASILWPFYSHGEVAVRLFWVISGFVFAHVYWNRGTSARSFGIARFARLYPLHLVTLLVVVVLQLVSLQLAGHWQVFGNNDVRHFFLQLFLLDQSLGYSSGLSFNGPIWSVSAELFAYLLFFLTLPLTKERPFGASVLLALAAFTTLSLRPDGFIIGQWAFVCAVFFFAGSACFAAFRAIRQTWLLPFGLAGIAFASAKIGDENVMLIALCCALVMTLATVEKSFAGRGRLVRFLANISYSIYLVHIPVQIVVLIIADVAFGASREFASSYLTLPIYLTSCIALAYATHVYFELPVGQWLRRRLQSR